MGFEFHWDFSFEFNICMRCNWNLNEFSYTEMGFLNFFLC